MDPNPGAWEVLADKGAVLGGQFRDRGIKFLCALAPGRRAGWGRGGRLPEDEGGRPPGTTSPVFSLLPRARGQSDGPG